MIGRSGYGKGSTYRRTDYAKWSEGWDRAFGKGSAMPRGMTPYMPPVKRPEHEWIVGIIDEAKRSIIACCKGDPDFQKQARMFMSPKAHAAYLALLTDPAGGPEAASADTATFRGLPLAVDPAMTDREYRIEWDRP